MLVEARAIDGFWEGVDLIVQDRLPICHLYQQTNKMDANITHMSIRVTGKKRILDFYEGRSMQLFANCCLWLYKSYG